MKPSTIKSNGIHYTPPELAAFLASATAEHTSGGRKLRVLDPACGDGALLAAFAIALPAAQRGKLELVGYDTNPVAVAESRNLLSEIGVAEVTIEEGDFLAYAKPVAQQRCFWEGERTRSEFDVVISNPPYVRTQVLGAAKARSLAHEFSLTGRVDLYHAFTMAMASVLRKGGTLGLLTSNRFLTIKSGESLRQLLGANFGLEAVYDLGDTKLFAAAVLPAIVIGRKGLTTTECRFDRVYQFRQTAAELHEAPSILEAVRKREIAGPVRTTAGVYSIERGRLAYDGNGGVWTLATNNSVRWLKVVQRHTRHTFHDVAKIRVGIKTTADEVFIRQTWTDLPEAEQPESQLVRPLIRHFDAKRWLWSGRHQQSVLYPHSAEGGRRRPVELRQFPRAERYLETHRERLTRRHYVIEGGRQWYEIWVPHNPNDWGKPKLVFPDISEEPRFFLDATGAIVNGDCYWMTLLPGFEMDHLFLMLAVANSTFITRYYDIAFHNKLYAGRRRFMTQYVKQFPLPDVRCQPAREAIGCVSDLVHSGNVVPELEARIDGLVWQSFGLVKEVGG